MSLYGVLRSGVSGMNAQSNKLGTVAENIQNASTTGYKRASTEFSSLILASGQGAYNSGAVTTTVRYSIGDQGPTSYTTSASDLAIQGNGFFVVSDQTGTPYLTRAGSFLPNGDGKLINAAGYQLMGYDISKGPANATLNGYSGLVPVDIAADGLEATPSTKGVFQVNLPANAENAFDVAHPSTAAEITLRLDASALPSAAPTPASNTAPSVPPAPAAPGSSSTRAKETLSVYDDAGNPVWLDIFFTKIGASPDQWEIAVFDNADAPPGPAQFPYTSGPLASSNTLTFGLDGNPTGTSPASISIPVPGGQLVTLDLSGITQSLTPTLAPGATWDRDGNPKVGASPADNLSASTFTKKSSIQVFDNVGNPVLLDVYMAKAGENEWEYTIFNQADAALGGGFPYSSPPLSTQMLTFDGMGQLIGSPKATFTIPNGQPFTLDLAGTTQLAGDYTPMTVTADGSAPSAIKGFEIGQDGTVMLIREDGSRLAKYQIPLADVPSPDNLKPVAGNVYEATINSGNVQIGSAREGGKGAILSGALEQSNVDIGTELTNMIEAQRGYQANSKTFQTGAELLDVLMNLKR